MPVIKIFCHQAPAPAESQQLALSLRTLCMDTMGAHPDAIELLLIDGVHVLDGAPVFVEAHYRDRPDRRGPLLDECLQGVDLAIQQAFGLQPRIRSFAVDQDLLGALR